MTTARIYCASVEPAGQTKTTRLIRATSKAQAGRFVARDTITVELATAEDGIEAGRLGIEVEDATAENETID